MITKLSLVKAVRIKQYFRKILQRFVSKNSRLLELLLGRQQPMGLQLLFWLLLLQALLQLKFFMKKLLIALFLIPFTLLSQQFGNNDITIFDQSVLSIINKNAKIEILAGSFFVAEGPLWDSDKGRLIFTDVRQNKIFTWDKKNANLKLNICFMVYFFFPNKCKVSFVVGSKITSGIRKIHHLGNVGVLFFSSICYKSKY